MRQQGVEEAISIRTERQAEGASVAVQGSSFNTVLTGQSVVVRKNSAGAEVVRPRLNLIEGANITITLADDPVSTEADITVAVVASPSVTNLTASGTVDAAAHKLSGAVQWTSGTGSPEGVVTAPVGSLYSRTDGGASTTLYVKESGGGNTGWIAK